MVVCALALKERASAWKNKKKNVFLLGLVFFVNLKGFIKKLIIIEKVDV